MRDRVCRDTMSYLFFSGLDAPWGAGRGLGWFISILPCHAPMVMDRHTPLEGSSGSMV